MANDAHLKGNHIGTIWHNVARHYTSARSHLTEGKIVSMANDAHPPEAIMFGEHGIMVKNILI